MIVTELHASLFMNCCAMQSLGVLLFYLCFQKLPFEGDCKLQVGRTIAIDRVAPYSSACTLYSMT